MKYNTKKYNKKSSKKYNKKSSKKYTKKSSKKYTKKFSKKFSKKGGTIIYPNSESTNAEYMINRAFNLTRDELKERDHESQNARKMESLRQEQARKAMLKPIIDELNRKYNNKKEIATIKQRNFRQANNTPPGLGTLKIKAKANAVMTERAAKAEKEAEWAAERSERAKAEAAAEAMAMAEADARSKLAEAEAARQEADTRLFGDYPKSYPIIWERARERAARGTARASPVYPPIQRSLFPMDI